MLLPEFLFQVVAMKPFRIQRLQSHFYPVVSVIDFFLPVLNLYRPFSIHLTIVVAFEVVFDDFLESGIVISEFQVQLLCIGVEFGH